MFSECNILLWMFIIMNIKSAIPITVTFYATLFFSKGKKLFKGSSNVLLHEYGLDDIWWLYGTRERMALISRHFSYSWGKIQEKISTRKLTRPGIELGSAALEITILPRPQRWSPILWQLCAEFQSLVHLDHRNSFFIRFLGDNKNHVINIISKCYICIVPSS